MKMKLTILPLLSLLSPTLAQLPTPTNPLAIPRPFTTNPAQWSSIYSSLVSASVIPTTIPYGPGYGPWGPGNYKGPGRGPNGPNWGGSTGCGPWGTSNWGPWSEWSTRSDWRTNGPWTHWWGGSACPGTDWPGWTLGPWSTSAPWTTWAGCTAKTTGSSTVVQTVSGSAVTSLQYAVQVQQVEGSGAVVTGTGTGVAGAAGSKGAAVPVKTGAPLAAVAGVVFGLAVGL